MTDEHTTSSRRSVLRVAGTIGIGAVGLTGAASANGTGKQRRTNDHGEERKGRKKRPKQNDHKNKRPKKNHGKKRPKKDHKQHDHKKKRPKKDHGKKHQATPDPVTETDKFVEHVRSEATKGVRK